MIADFSLPLPPIQVKEVFLFSVTLLLPSPAILMAMDSHSPLISSFVIRFVQNEAEKAVEDSSQHLFRGSIRHIQSDEEMNFYLWDEAVAFIQRYVPIESKTSSDSE